MSAIESKVIEITAETLGIDKTKINKDSRFVDDLGAQSLDKVELMMALEAEFQCDIPDDKAASIVTISDASQYIETIRNPKPE